MYWKNRYKRNIRSIKEKWRSDGQGTPINNFQYQSAKNMDEELILNFDTEKVAEGLELSGSLRRQFVNYRHGWQ
jgi:hypothetical protein